MTSFKKLYESYDDIYASSSMSSNKDKILRLRKITGLDSDAAEEILSENDWNLDSAIDAAKGKKKKPKDKKLFKMGDIVVCIDPKPGKLPQDCVDFLITYKKFRVLSVNDKYNIDLGHKFAENGNPYFFSPSRFELMNGTAPIMKPDGTIVEPGKETPQAEPITTAGKSGKKLSDEIIKDIISKNVDKKKIEDFSNFKKPKTASDYYNDDDDDAPWHD